MDLGLAGKVAIVSGGSQGIGYAIARLLAEEGSRVAVTARRAPALHAAAERIRSETSADVIAIQGDIRQAVDCRVQPGRILQQRGDVVKQNAGFREVGHVANTGFPIVHIDGRWRDGSGNAALFTVVT